MPVSNFSAYFKRKFKLNGHVFIDKQREVAQLQDGKGANITPPTENKYLQYAENAPVYGGYSNITEGGRAGSYMAYSPGQVYIPKKSAFTKKDAFPDGFFNYEKYGEVATTFEDTVLNMIRHSFKPNYDSESPFCFGYMNPDDLFIYDEDLGIYAFWSVVCTGTNVAGLIKKRNLRFAVTLTILKTTIDPNKLVIGLNSGNTAEWLYDDNGKIRQLEYGTEKLFGPYANQGQIFHFEATDTYNRLAEGVEKYFSIFNKIKFYFCFNSYNYKNSPDEAPYFYTSYKYSELKTVGILTDISNCPYFPTFGFYISKNYMNIRDLFFIDTHSGGPEPNNPNITDDPNDDDPGSGPGQNPGDSGGDGDHDNTSDDIKPPSVPTLSASGAGLITAYNPTVNELASLASALWNPTALDAIKQYFTNPMDTILGLGIVPVKPVTGASKKIMLGVYDSGVTASVIDSDYVIVNCGSIPITRYYGSYLDYSPYTKIKCYLPYIGEVDVNPDEVMQTSLMVLYYVNVLTGDIVAMICSNGKILYTAAGNCIRQLPLSNSDYSQIINTAVSAVSGIAIAAATAGVGAAATGAALAGKEAVASARATANNVGSATSLIGDITNAKFNYNHAGSLGTGAGQLSYQKPYLIIERPNLDLPDNYKSLVGYPCNKTLGLNKCVGFTQIEASNISVSNATDEEVAEIKELLLRGVII